MHISDKCYWLNLRSAVGRIRAHTGLSTGATQALLHKICPSGEVRSRGQDPLSLSSSGKEGLLPLLSENNWLGRSINLDSGHLEGPGGGIFGSITNVTVSAEDLDWWLRNRWNPESAPGHHLGRRSGEAIDKATELLSAHAGEAGGAFMPTGAPGRPTKGMHLIRAEYDRRFHENVCKPTLREEATELRQWFCRSYPTAPALSIKTIENNLRSDYRQRVSKQQTT